MFIQRAPAAIFACTFMETLFTSAATSCRTLMAMIYISLKGNLSQDYAVCLFLKTSLVLTLSQTSPGFLRVCSKSLLRTLREKEKSLLMSNFYFFHSVFIPFGELSAIFI